jgi:protein Tex
MQEQQYISVIAAEVGAGAGQVGAVAALLDEGATVPFLARYRKEATGGLDEVQIAAVRDRLTQWRDLEKRRQAVLASLEEQGVLDDNLRRQVDEVSTMTALEDLYLPYRPKRRTRATIARERGLEPLAEILLKQESECQPESEAAAFVDAAKEVENAEAALAGARDIIAEKVSEDARARRQLRQMLWRQGRFASRVIPGKEEEAAKFRDYFDGEEPVAQAASHRLLAMRRGEKALFLSLRLQAPEEQAHDLLDELFVEGDGAAADQVGQAARDAYKRLILPSLETEIRVETKERADAQAIAVFAENMRQLLLAAPLGQKRIMAIDPGFRTGCKTVCLDAQGKLLHTETLFPHQGANRAQEAAARLLDLCERHKVEAVAVGNGTAGRETEAFVRQTLVTGDIDIELVNESGASVYSASQVARDEFPDHDLTVRGAVSIGRRLADPLAELVKIDPKSIGVGQYQHDVDQGALKRSLDDTVFSCVNSVGVEVNTASKELLSYVSGLGPQLAGNIIAFRDENGPFQRRRQLLEVPRLGPKAFEQAAGFLRIRGGTDPLDASAVHPERYGLVGRMATDAGCGVEDLLGDETRRGELDLDRYVDTEVGRPTLEDIVAELARPGRDPRPSFERFSYAEGVDKISDLRPGMKLPGLVTNITAFGAFVDIGVHQDGLVHVSQLADRYVGDPNQVVKLRQQVEVTVLEIDIERQRISLSMRRTPQAEGAPQSTTAGPKDKRATEDAEPQAPKTSQQRHEQRPRRQRAGSDKSGGGRSGGGRGGSGKGGADRGGSGRGGSGKGTSGSSDSGRGDSALAAALKAKGLA